MKIIAIEHESPDATGADFAPLLRSEAETAWTLYREGSLREIYFRTDRDEAVLILECESLEKAGEVVGRLPLVKAGLIRFELIPLGPYPGFERLFGTSDGI